MRKIKVRNRSSHYVCFRSLALSNIGSSKKKGLVFISFQLMGTRVAESLAFVTKLFNVLVKHAFILSIEVIAVLCDFLREKLCALLEYLKSSGSSTAEKRTYTQNILSSQGIHVPSDIVYELGLWTALKESGFTQQVLFKFYFGCVIYSEKNSWW